MITAVVLLSGGLDSATCLAMAVDKHGSENVAALSIFYGQRRRIERRPRSREILQRRALRIGRLGNFSQLKLGIAEHVDRRA